MAWLDISTAPRDGRELWLLKKRGDVALKMRWSTHYSVFGLGGCWTDGLCTMGDGIDFTHWMEIEDPIIGVAIPDNVVWC